MAATPLLITLLYPKQFGPNSPRRYGGDEIITIPSLLLILIVLILGFPGAIIFGVLTDRSVARAGRGGLPLWHEPGIHALGLLAWILVLPGSVLFGITARHLGGPSFDLIPILYSTLLTYLFPALAITAIVRICSFYNQPTDPHGERSGLTTQSHNGSVAIARLTLKRKHLREWQITCDGISYSVRYTARQLGRETVYVDGIAASQRTGSGPMSHGYVFDLNDVTRVSLIVAIPWWCELLPLADLSFVRLELNGECLYEEGQRPNRSLQWSGPQPRGFEITSASHQATLAEPPSKDQ